MDKYLNIVETTQELSQHSIRLYLDFDQISIETTSTSSPTPILNGRISGKLTKHDLLD